MSTNPLVVLGIPRELAARELASHSLGRLRAYTRGHYRTLSRYYHPDKGGDADQMAAYSQAAGEIETASDLVLTFWIEEIADAKALRAVDQIDQLRGQLTERGGIIRHLLPTLVGVDQFAVMGITEPTSFLHDLDPGSFDQVVIDVRSPSDTVASLALRPEKAINPRYIAERRLIGNVWHDVLRTPQGRVVKRQPIPLTSPVSVAIIGRAELTGNPTVPFADLALGELERRAAVRHITWHDPLKAWFMPKLGYTEGGLVLVDASGRHVAITGDVASA